MGSAADGRVDRPAAHLALPSACGTASRCSTRPTQRCSATCAATAAQFDSKHAALYYPWVTIVDPVTASRDHDLPPSGFVAGIYARNDIERGVHKAPANEVVRAGASASRLPINKGQQDVLNPEGVNCLRFFEGRGFRVWGARTITLRPGVEVRQPAALLRLPRALDRARARSGRSSSPTATRCGPTCGARSRTSCSTSCKRAPARRHSRRRRSSCVRPHHDDAERPRQRPADLPDRRRAAAPGRVRDLPHRPEDARLSRRSGGDADGHFANARTGRSTSWSTSATDDQQDSKAGFQEVSGLGMEITVAEYRAGNKRRQRARQDHRHLQGPRRHAQARRDRRRHACTAGSTQVRKGKQADALRTVTIELLGEDREPAQVVEASTPGRSSTPARRSAARAPTSPSRSWCSPARTSLEETT